MGLSILLRLLSAAHLGPQLPRKERHQGRQCCLQRVAVPKKMPGGQRMPEVQVLGRRMRKRGCSMVVAKGASWQGGAQMEGVQDGEIRTGTSRGPGRKRMRKRAGPPTPGPGLPPPARGCYLPSPLQLLSEARLVTSHLCTRKGRLAPGRSQAVTATLGLQRGAPLAQGTRQWHRVTQRMACPVRVPGSMESQTGRTGAPSWGGHRRNGSRETAGKARGPTSSWSSRQLEAWTRGGRKAARGGGQLM